MILWWKKILDDYAVIEDELSKESKDYKKIALLNKKLSKLTPAYNLAKRAKILEEDLRYLGDFLSDETAREMLKANKRDSEEVYEKFLQLCEESDAVNKAIIEIRPGTGGDESSIFADNLLQMYQAYAKDEGWSTEILEIDFNDETRGIKNVTLLVEGTGAYDKLQFEAGVHRIQRIPVTEACGRIHTSTATVAVLPESEDADVVIDEKYLRTDVFRAGGAGGQHVNKTESAVRLTYHPLELNKAVTVSIQDEKSQHKNRAKAMKILKIRVAQQLQGELDADRAQQRKTQIGKALRSEKIRTYNYQQNRVTDHRCKISFYSLQTSSLLLPAHLSKIIEALRKMGKRRF